jgi:hypothetical protein
MPVVRRGHRLLTEHGIGYRQKNVSEGPAAFAGMQRKSGQGAAPVLDWHARILADFGVDELTPFLHLQEMQFEDS